MDNQNVTSADMPQFASYLILSVLMLFCNLICGVIALIFTFEANASYKAGNTSDYDTKAKYAKTALIVGASLLAIGIIFSVLFSVIICTSAMATM